ncbi:MAG TPA: hypothetical protein GXZ36_08350 [Firmicutes bacterium]|nr:hypothetical protein [Bacillota bacterium]
MKDKTRQMLIFSGVVALGGLAFFIYSFRQWWTYDSTIQTSPNPAFALQNSVSTDRVENLPDQVVIVGNPFFPERERPRTPEAFPRLHFNGLILGERKLAVLEEAEPPYRSWIVQEGDWIFGAQVMRISRLQVELSRDGGSIILKIQEESTGQ